MEPRVDATNKLESFQSTTSFDKKDSWLAGWERSAL